MKLLSVLNVLVRIACTMPNNAKVDVITELSVRRRCGHSPNTFVHLFLRRTGRGRKPDSGRSSRYDNRR